MNVIPDKLVNEANYQLYVLCFTVDICLQEIEILELLKCKWTAI